MRKLFAGIGAGAILLTVGGAFTTAASADGSSGPQFANVAIAGYASNSLPVSFTVSDSSGTLQTVNISVNNSVVQTLQTSDMTPQKSGSYLGTVSIPTATYADGQSLTVLLSASDDNSSDQTGIAGQTVVVDHTRPAVAFIGDLAYQTNPTAVVAFTATDTHLLSVSCRLDQLAATPCADSITYTGLTAGLHVVHVAAVDLAGNTTTTAFQITNGAPRIVAITGGFTTTLLRDSTGRLVATVVGNAVPAVLPTGSVTVTAGGRQLGTATLTGSGTADVATATLPVTTLDPTRVPMTIGYSGDAFYPAANGLSAFFVHPYAAMKLVSSVRRNASVTVAISCPASAVGCRGAATLGGRTVKLSPAPGRTVRVSFPLPASALTALRVRGTANLRLDLASGLATVRRLTITLRNAGPVGRKAQRKVT